MTGAQALAYLNDAEDQLKEAASLVKGGRENLLDKLGGILERNRQLEKELEQLKAKAASAALVAGVGPTVDSNGRDRAFMADSGRQLRQ